MIPFRLPMPVDDALQFLRTWLLATDPSGPGGFEGLVRSCLQALTGVPMRLARSGSQFGRDASAAPESVFGVAMEAKRYANPPSLEDIAAKAAVGALSLQGHAELWVLGATAEVGDDVVFKSWQLLEQQGMSLLVLDWSSHGLPRLATILAAHPDVVIDWWSTAKPYPPATELAPVLEAIRAHANFDAALATIREETQVPLVGLGMLREFSAQWMEARLSSSAASKRSLGQNLSVRTGDAPVLPRAALQTRVTGAIAAANEINLGTGPNQLPAVVAVLGEEGTGKSWLIAQWWTMLSDPPVLLFISGRRMRSVAATGSSHPLRALASLLAEQEGRDDSDRIEQWYRRLRRWAQHGPSAVPRFVIVLDGLNEHPYLDWADVLAAFASTARDLGGLLVASARPAFWQQQVQRRVRASAAVHEVLVDGYSDAEVEDLLRRAGVDEPFTLPLLLRQFLRTPRVAAVALHLLDRLTLDPSELTRERLLLAYWQRREEERGDLVVHSAEEFARVLASHARLWRERQHPFLLDDWTAHSGVVQRDGIERARRDLTEIAEGRFLMPVVGRPDQYTFRPEVLPFAIATLIVTELRDVMDENPAWNADTLQDFVERELEPVGGFDAIADIVVAAVGLACLDLTFPVRARRALVRTWLDLQNRGADGAELLASYVSVDPALFLDMLGEREGGQVDLGHHHALLRPVLATRDHPAVASAVEERVPAWLTRWSVPGERVGDGERAAEWQSKLEARRAETLSQMHPAEQEAFHRLTQALPHAGIAVMTRAAAMLLATRPLAPVAYAVTIWALSTIVTPDAFGAAEDLQWVALLNNKDPEVFSAALSAEIRRLMPNEGGASLPMRRAAALALRLSGEIHHAEQAERLDPWPAYSGWRKVEDFCETDPYAPAAARGDRVDATVSRLDSLPMAELWASNGVTREDSDLEAALPALARFEPAALVRNIREIIQSAASRDWGSLHALSLQLRWLAPLIDGPTHEALLVAFARLVSGDVHPPNDPRQQQAAQQTAQLAFVAARYAGVAMQHLDVAEQLALLARMPVGALLFLDLRDYAKPMPSSLLTSAMSDGSADLQRWALLLAGARRLEVTDALRTHLIALLREDSRERVVLAAQAIRAAADPALDHALLERAAESNRPLDAFADDDYLTSAITGAVSRHATPATIELLRLDVLPHAVAFGPDGIAAFDAAVLQLFEHFSPATDALEELGTSLVVGGRRRSRGDAERALLEFPSVEALAGFVQRHREAALAWCRSIADQGSPALWMRVAPFAVTLAGVLAPTDGPLAAKVVQRGIVEEQFTRVIINGVDVLQRACFADTPELWPLQESLILRCLTDAALEEVVRAAEAAGAEARLDELATWWLTVGTPALVARAVTIVGLRTSPGTLAGALAVDRGPGVLGTITQWARRQAERDQWMSTWLSRASAATDPVDMWRFSTLATRLADTRFRHAWAELEVRSDIFHPYAPTVWERGLEQVKRRTEKRMKTLFGLRAPADDLRRALRA